MHTESPFYRWSWLYTGASPGQPEEHRCREACAEAADKWHIAGAVGPRVLRWSSKFCDSEEWQTLEQRSIGAGAIAGIQSRAALEIGMALTAAGVQYAFLKAAALRLMDPNGFNGRCGWDIDLGIHREDLARVYELLGDVGYRLQEGPEQPLRYGRHFEAAPCARSFEVQPTSDREDRLLGAEALRGQLPLLLRQRSRFSVEVSVDIQMDLGFDLSLAELLETRCSVPAGPAVPSKAYLLFLLTRKLYLESTFEYASNMHMYFDIISLMRLMRSNEFIEALALFQNSNNDLAAFYVFRRLPLSFGIPVPEELLSLVEEYSIVRGHTPASLNDFGDMWPNMVGVR